MPDKSASTEGRLDMKSTGGVYDQDGNQLISPSGAMTLYGDFTIGDASADTLTINATSQINAPLTVGEDDTGYDVKFFGATASAYMLWDESDDALKINGDARLDFSGATIKAANTDGGLIRGGTSGAKITEDTADMKFISFYFDSGATSGDSRGIYLRHELTGAGGGGESLRSFTKISAACSTARGSHISLDLDAAGSLSGFGAGVDAQLMLGAAAYDDDITVQNLEIYANAGASITGRTSFLRPVIQGDSTAVADVNANAFFIDFSNVAASATGLIDTDITALTGYGSLRVRCPDGVTRYIPITTGS